MKRFILFLGLAGAMTAGIAFGLPGDQPIVALLGGAFTGFGVTSLWGELK